MAAASKTDRLSDQWVGLPQAAAELGESRLKVLSRTVTGELEADHLAGRTVISRASLDRLLADRAAS